MNSGQYAQQKRPNIGDLGGANRVGHRVFVPFDRVAQLAQGIARLEAFVNAAPDRYLPLSDTALRLAAEIWAESRRAGRPTADAKALDIDVLLAAQVLSLGNAAVVATTNPKHLSQFIPARLWTDIDPAAFRVKPRN